VIGGGNVGLIAAYHALQAGIDVLGLVEAMPEVGGYKVHADKLLRLGTPIWTRHTVVEAFGNNHVEGVTIAEVDDKFRPIPGTYRRFNVDTVLVAVGLSPVNEFVEKAREFGMKVYASGDAEEIAEASAAIFSGKIKGRRIARELGREVDIPDEWAGLAEVLKSRPGVTKPMEYIPAEGRFQAVLHCNQEIPCNPCVDACPFGLITIEGSIMGLPSFNGRCTGCAKCVLNCPGLAITLVDHDRDPSHEFAVVTLPFEFNDDVIPGDKVLKVTDIGGDVLGEGRVLRIRRHRSWRRRALLDVAVPWDIRLRTAGFRIRTPMDGYEPVDEVDIDDDPIICRCERVRKSEIVRAIEDGVRDMNELKALLRTGMGACGGKTCTELIKGIFRELGVDPVSVTPPTTRPLFFEVPLGVFANSQAKGGRDEK
jgi:ferredoxin